METFEQQEEDDRGQYKTTSGIAPGVERSAVNGPRLWSVDSSHAAIQVDVSVYSIDSILRAAYKLTDRAFFFVSPHEENAGLCIVFIGMKSKDRAVESLLPEFVNELLDQRLRERLEEEFGGLRTLIVAQAFSEGNLLDSQRDNRDYRDNPEHTEEPR